MGCDMHAIVEEKNTVGKWETVEQIDVERWYLLFAHLAGVRNHETRIAPVAEPKGFPHDLSLGGEDLKEYWDMDGHTASWLTPDELRNHDFSFNGEPLDLPYWLTDFINSGSDSRRLVFCFDN